MEQGGPRRTGVSELPFNGGGLHKTRNLNRDRSQHLTIETEPVYFHHLLMTSRFGTRLGKKTLGQINSHASIPRSYIGGQIRRNCHYLNLNASKYFHCGRNQ